MSATLLLSPTSSFYRLVALASGKVHFNARNNWDMLQKLLACTISKPLLTVTNWVCSSGVSLTLRQLKVWGAQSTKSCFKCAFNFTQYSRVHASWWDRSFIIDYFDVIVAKYEFNRIAFYIHRYTIPPTYIYMMTLPYDTLEWRSVMSVVMRHLWTRFRDGGGGGWKMRRFSLVDIDVYMQSSTYIIKSPLHIYNMQISSRSA